MRLLFKPSVGVLALSVLFTLRSLSIGADTYLSVYQLDTSPEAIFDSAETGGIVYLATTEGLYVMQRVGDSRPNYLKVYHISEQYTLSEVLNFLQALNLTPEQIKEYLAKFYPFNKAMNGLFLSGSLAYVTVGNRRFPSPKLHIYDISQPLKPRKISQIQLPEAEILGHSGALGIYVDDRKVAYVGGYGAGLILIDVTNPWSPKLLSQFTLNNPELYTCPNSEKKIIRGHVWWFEVKKKVDRSGARYLGYLPYDSLGFHIVDVTDRRKPIQLGSVDFNNVLIQSPDSSAPSCREHFFNDVTVKNDTAYIALDYGGLLLVDVAVPSAPRIIRQMDLYKGDGWGISSGHSVQIEKAKDTLFVTGLEAGLMIFNIADPLRPVPIQRVPTMGCAWGLTVNAASVYIGNVLSRHGDALDRSGFEVVE